MSSLYGQLRDAEEAHLDPPDDRPVCEFCGGHESDYHEVACIHCGHEFVACHSCSLVTTAGDVTQLCGCRTAKKTKPCEYCSGKGRTVMLDAGRIYVVSECPRCDGKGVVNA
jgi:hypothetical protein